MLFESVLVERDEALMLMEEPEAEFRKVQESGNCLGSASGQGR